MAQETSVIPRYRELPLIAELGMRHAWDFAGRDDVLGTIGRITPASVLAAAAEVREGLVINLTLPVTEPSPPLYGRSPLVHDLFASGRNSRDEKLDNFFLQASSQWDGLGHIRCREFGFWGGRQAEPSPTNNEIGIGKWVEHGMVGRGVLVDVEAELARRGDYDPFVGLSIGPDVIEAALAHQSVTLRRGDFLCLKFGWMAKFKQVRSELTDNSVLTKSLAGLAGTEEMAEFLWDSEVAAVVGDNPSLEWAPGSPQEGSLHRRCIPLLGFAFGELFDLDELSAACQRSGRWTFMFAAAPLNLPAAVGSPANAIGIL